MGFLVHGPQCSLVWQMLAWVIMELSLLSPSSPEQLLESLRFWLSQESGCKWRRQGRNEHRDIWSGPRPGLKASLFPTARLALISCPPHQHGVAFTGRAGVCPQSTSNSSGWTHQGIHRAVFPRSRANFPSGFAPPWNRILCANATIVSQISNLFPFVHKIHCQESELCHGPLIKLKLEGKWKEKKTTKISCPDGRIFDCVVCTLFLGSLREVLWF